MYIGKKRLFISILLSVLFDFFLLKDYFILHEPIMLNFAAEGNGKAELKVSFVKKIDAAFNTYDVTETVINPFWRQKNKIELRTRRISKLLFEFKNVSGDLRLDDIYFAGEKISGLTAADIVEGQKYFKDGKIIISGHSKASLLINKKIVAPMVVDIKILIVIAALSFLLSYKLIQYLARFKIYEHHSRIDIVFLCFVVLLLFFPMSEVEKAKILPHENRGFAAAPHWFVENRFNKNFGKQFEGWFNDRFYGRETAINFFQKIIYGLAGRAENKVAFVSKENWMFNRDYYQAFEPWNEVELAQITAQIAKLRDYCKANDIKLYLMIAPVKEDLYREYAFRQTGVDRTFQLVEYVKDKLDFEIIFAHSELLKAKEQDYVFFKGDHHLTDWGAYTEYQVLMKQIQKDFPDVKIVDENDYNFFQHKWVRAETDRDFIRGNTVNLLNLKDDKFNQVDYNYYQNKDEKNLRDKYDAIEKKREYFYAQGYPKNVVVIGNSFVENLMQFLPYSFERVKKMRSNNSRSNGKEMDLRRFVGEIQNFDTDILILSFDSVYASHLQEMFEEE